MGPWRSTPVQQATPFLGAIAAITFCSVGTALVVAISTASTRSLGTNTYTGTFISAVTCSLGTNTCTGTFISAVACSLSTSACTSSFVSAVTCSLGTNTCTGTFISAVACSLSANTGSLSSDAGSKTFGATIATCRLSFTLGTHRF